MTRAVRSLARAIGATLAVTLVAWSTVAAQVDPSIFEGMAARSIGPAGMSGRIGAIDAVESNTNIIYVGAATGGLWKSVDGGLTFEPIMDDLPASSIGAVAIFQAAPDIVWIGTGEKGRRNSAGSGTGVYKSMDGGKTWELLGLRNTGAIAEIILHPNDPNVAYVGALGNTWAETADRGVYKTNDGGKTWSKILFVDEKTGVADLVMDPANPNKLFAAMWEHRRWPWFFNSGGPGSGLYVTWDGGANWKRYTTDDGMPEGDLGRIGLDVSRSNPNIVYALVEAKRSVMLRSNDAGHSWETVNKTDGIANRPFYYGQVRVDPENENRVYNVAGSVTISEDGGKSFQPFSGWAQSVHVDHHAWWIDPNDGRLIINGNDGGVYITYDRGGSWTFVHTLPLAQFYHINVDMDTPFNVYGGLQDNGSWKGPSSVWENGGIRFYHWDEVGFGDGFATVVDANNPRYGYAMSQGGYIIRFDKETGERKEIKPVHPDGVELRFNWNAGIAIDPFDGCVFYGSQFVHKTCDMGQNWTIISPDLTTNDPEKQKQLDSGGLTYDVTGAENHTTIITIAPSPVEQGVIWVGTDDGNVQVTTDGGTTWNNVVGRARNVPDNTYVTHVEPSKFEGGTAFVTFDDHRRGNNTPYVFRVTNYGRSWTSLVTDQIENFNFVHVIEQDPVDANLLFLGTEYGMYVTLNGGQSWFRYDHGLGRFPHRALVLHPRDHDLVVGSHGRAAYILDDVRPLRALAANPSLTQHELHLFDIPDAMQYYEAQVGGIRFTGQALFIGENRPYGALLTYFVREGDDSTKVTVEVLDANDTVIRKFEGPAKPGINRTSWNLRHDGYRRPSGGGGIPSEFLPPGPAALPGTYTVRITHGDSEVTALVVVSADPRFDVTQADRQEKHRLLMDMVGQAEVGTEAVERIRSTTKAVDQVLGQVGSKEDSTSKALAEAGKELKEQLEALEVRYRGERDVQGIRRDPNTVQSKFFEAYGSMSSSWDKPTEAELLALEQGRAALAGFLDELNRLFAEDVAAFRDQAQAADLDLFPEKEPLSLDWTPKGR
jgi:photosystem II stability/assembly factor-like uncharacterized protein